MPKKAPALANIGDVEKSESKSTWRARVKHLSADKKQEHIRGPWRSEPAQAQKDLEDMRACGALFGEDRTKGLEAMKVEARQIQERAAHEREIRHAKLLRGPSGFDSDASDNFDPDIEDPDEWWQELQDGKVPKTVIQPKKKTPSSSNCCVLSTCQCFHWHPPSSSDGCAALCRTHTHSPCMAHPQVLEGVES